MLNKAPFLNFFLHPLGTYASKNCMNSILLFFVDGSGVVFLSFSFTKDSVLEWRNPFSGKCKCQTRARIFARRRSGKYRGRFIWLSEIVLAIPSLEGKVSNRKKRFVEYRGGNYLLPSVRVRKTRTERNPWALSPIKNQLWRIFKFSSLVVYKSANFFLLKVNNFIRN